PWRFLAAFLENPFPDNVLIADGGHREIFPSLVRLAELQWFGANQWLQILVGFTLAVTTVIYLLRSLPSETQVERASTALVVAIGLFWLGNSRKLAHGNESVHQFMVCLCLLQGMRWLNSEH